MSLDKATVARIATLARARLLTRVGVIVRHRALGWTANAMVVWQLPDAAIEPAGRALAQVPGVTGPKAAAPAAEALPPVNHPMADPAIARPEL